MEPVYISRVRIVREQGPMRLAYLPAEETPVRFGVHGEIASHYGVPERRFPSHATTIDYVVAAAAGWLTGTFGGALEARQIDASQGKLVGEATGEIESDAGVLIIRRIHVTYRLQASEDRREVIERTHSMHARHCPVYRSLEAAIRITTSFELQPPG